jgi:four helix bundle protein
MSESFFPHERLEVFKLALDLAHACNAVANEMPKGYAKISDNLTRASQGVPLLIAEGANRPSDGQKRQRFGEARGEVGECAAAIQLALRLEVISADAANSALGLCQSVGAMLTKLIQRFE